MNWAGAARASTAAYGLLGVRILDGVLDTMRFAVEVGLPNQSPNGSRHSLTLDCLSASSYASRFHSAQPAIMSLKCLYRSRSQFRVQLSLDRARLGMSRIRR